MTNATTHTYAGDVSAYSVTVVARNRAKRTATVKIAAVVRGPGTIPIGATVTVPAARVTPDN